MYKQTCFLNIQDEYGSGYIPNLNFTGCSDSKKSTCNVGELGLIPGLGKSPGEGNSYPLQYSCMKNCMDRGAWQATVQWSCKDLEIPE